MEDGNHSLDCHCSPNFFHNAIFQTEIDRIGIKHNFGRAIPNCSFSIAYDLCCAAYFDETI